MERACVVLYATPNPFLLNKMFKLRDMTMRQGYYVSVNHVHLDNDYSPPCDYPHSITSLSLSTAHTNQAKQVGMTHYTVVSRYYDVCYIEILLITIPYLYPKQIQNNINSDLLYR
jgi:hypothetical protein